MTDPIAPGAARSTGFATEGESLKYRADVDGLRAVAVLAVVFYHLHLRVRGGYVGVDVFFVISGYLISGLILKDLDRGRFSLVDFWVRRVRRIFPALLVVTLFCLAVGWFVLLPVDFQDLGDSIVAQALLVSNVYFFGHFDYFAQPAELMPLLHTWSLAVEEQFYLFFPFLLIACRRLSRNALVKVISLLCAASLGISIYESYSYPSAGYYLLPSRAFELLIGVIPALLPGQCEVPRWVRESLSGAGLLAICCAIFLYQSSTRFPGLAAALPCAGAALLIWANGTGATLVRSFLGRRPVAFIGLISYSLYLWHWPILVFCKYSLLGAPTSPQRLTILVASFVLATMSWRWVETPFRRRVLFQGRIEIVSFAAISAVALVAIGLVVAHLKGIPSRFSGRELAYANGSLDKGIRTEVDLEAAESGRFVNLGESDGRSAPSIFVWGDSHAMALLSVFDTLCHEHKVFGLAATHSATAPLLDFETPRAFSLGSESVPYNDAVMEYIQKTKIHNVVLAAMWASYGSNIDHFRDCLKTTVDRLKGAGVRIWIVRQVPRPGVNVPSVLTVLSRLGEDGGDGPAWSTALYHQDRATEDRMFQGAASTGVTILDPSPFFIDAQGGLVVVDEGKPLYFDDHHISTVGAERLRNLLDPIFDAASEGH